MTEVIMPKMGDGMEEGTLVEWLKKDGESVKTGEIIGTIQTDKATLELEAPGTGKLTGILIKNGETVPVGVPIAVLLADGESLPKNWGTKGSSSSQAKIDAIDHSLDKLAANSADAPGSSQVAVNSGSDSGRVKASPLAKKIAAELGIDLHAVVGTGPGGRIQQEDVLAASKIVSIIPAASSFPTETLPKPSDQIIPFTRLKKITGERTQQSKLQAPHIYVTVEVDVEKIAAIRDMFASEGEPKPSINDFVIRACALALREMPIANSSFTSDGILIHGEINIGIAAAIEEGLTVPVIKNADHLSLRQISATSKDLVKRAKENKLSLDQLSGSTFAISNMGMMDIDNFCAIINTPNAAILAIGSARKKVVANDNDEIEIRERMNITGSFDHRLLDGADSARFLNIVKSYLQSPTKLLS